MDNIFSDFKAVESASQEIIREYEDSLPKEIIDIWRLHGFGSFFNGYIKVVNPNDYRQVLEESYFRNDVAIPIFTTGLGDIITWEENKYLMLIKYRKSQLKGISFKYFFSDLEDEEFVEEELDSTQYFSAVEKHGSLKQEECFGYTPLLGLGGAEKVDNLKKVKLKEHIMIITEFMGPIQ
ncbi:DUF1851 domain-containing protein [Listeria booriae]|uniref:DUF1851 domain-containing protein n=1 Tax=Listeria booriae TaxID=1552123 RepID=A0A099WDH2_9LIST|nr:T6SS immunity protein Tdi1 domain-containing protein [Listeria booriae]KGL42726.1 hypothetical protein EP57_04520 [Listeria booriae]MBC1561426.1 DUF1851 domain-containing protein [Listeria booriae]MBC1906118.1 DUF1851 domain-containing protein [Listeria booriae]MBC1912206.1 DUF1851 domain-containing protein [Listeria booriae]MBC2056224.1 DUF1851 domain-containing protein [Listeria booriae]